MTIKFGVINHIHSIKQTCRQNRNNFLLGCPRFHSLAISYWKIERDCKSRHRLCKQSFSNVFRNNLPVCISCNVCCNGCGDSRSSYIDLPCNNLYIPCSFDNLYNQNSPIHIYNLCKCSLRNNTPLSPFSYHLHHSGLP